MFTKKFSLLERINFLKNFHLLLKSGLNLIEIFEILSVEAESREAKKVFQAMLVSISSGKSLTESFEDHPRYFDKVFTAAIRAGEQSGTLDRNISFLAEELENSYNIKKNLQAAAFYPLLVLGLAIVILFFIFLFVIPRVASVFAKLQLKVPVYTQILFSISAILSRNILSSILFLIFIVLVFVFVWRVLKPVRLVIFSFFKRLPGINKLVQAVNLAKYARTLSLLFASGIPILESLELAANVFEDPVYRSAMPVIKDDVSKGVSLDMALGAWPDLFPQMYRSAVAVGWKSGNLDQVLIDLAVFYERKAANILKTLSTLIEPLLIVVVGTLVALIVITIIAPIYQLIGRIGAR
ncbi:MAG: type II secretion system F family protein [Parcubacteria group bacterium]|nr:type II secretion system F family protein [Parcubacteria group bacterium]